MVTLYNLMMQQLSKQTHYDFGLRAIKSVLNCAGMIRREKSSDAAGGKEGAKERDKEAEIEESNQEQIILMRAIRDMNLPKFVQDDIFLFNALFNDLFPNMDLQDTANLTFTEAIENELKL
jgi:dynein heavy chain